MSTTAMTATVAVLKEQANHLAKHDDIVRAMTLAKTVAPDLRIQSQDDDDQATADRAVLKAGVKVVAEGLTEMFREVKDIEKRTRDFFAPVKSEMDAAVDRIDEAKKRRVREENARLAAEAEARRKANEAAAAAAALATEAEEPGDEPAPPPAEVFVPEEKAPTFSTVGSAKAKVKSSPVKAELWLDPALAPPDARAAAILEAAKRWPHLLTLDTVAAKAEFNALVARGQVEKPSEAGTVIGGIRFFTDLVVSG